MAKLRTIDDGLVVLFEGLDGVGKTTQLQLAAEALKSEGWAVHTTRNLGGTPIGELLRKVTLSDVERSSKTNFYISVAIQAALAESLAVERSKGNIILVDRGPLSLAAYHIYGSKVDKKLGWEYVSRGMELFRPELTLFFEAEVEMALARARQESHKADYYESKPIGYFKDVAEGYAEAVKKYKVRPIDASKSINAIHETVMVSLLSAASAKHKHV